MDGKKFEMITGQNNRSHEFRNYELLLEFSLLSLCQLLKKFNQDAYQERLRDMARRSLDNLPRFALIVQAKRRKGANSNRRGGTDKSALKLTNNF